MHYLPDIFARPKYKEILWGLLGRYRFQPAFVTFPDFGEGEVSFELSMTGQLNMYVDSQKFIIGQTKFPQALHQYFGMNSDFVNRYHINHKEYEKFVSDLNEVFSHKKPHELPTPIFTAPPR